MGSSDVAGAGIDVDGSVGVVVSGGFPFATRVVGGAMDALDVVGRLIVVESAGAPLRGSVSPPPHAVEPIPATPNTIAVANFAVFIWFLQSVDVNLGGF